MTTARAAQEVEPALAPLRRDRPLQIWVAAATLSAAGDAVFTLALAWTAVHLYSALLAGVIISVETVPQAALTLAGGVLADRVDVRGLLVVGEVARGTVLLAAAGIWSLWHLPALLLVLAFAFGVVAGLTNPSRGVLTRQLVRDDDLPVLNGWMQIGYRLAQLSGAPVGAVAVTFGGLDTAMVADAATFAGTAAVLALVVRSRRRLRVKTPEPWRESLRDLRRYLAADQVARVLTWGLCSLNVMVTPVESLGVVLRVSTSHWSAAWVGAAGACCAAGAILGSAAAMRWRKGRQAARGFQALILQGAALAAVGLNTPISLVTAMTLLGLTAGLASVWLSSAFLTHIAPTHLGRVTSVSQLGDQVAVPVTVPLFGLLAGRAGVLTATLTCGTVMTVWCAVLVGRRAIRTLQ